MFEHLCIKTEEPGTGIVDNLEEDINNQFQALESKIQRFFWSSLNKKWDGITTKPI